MGNVFFVGPTHQVGGARVRRGGAVVAAKPVEGVPGVPGTGAGIKSAVAGSAGFVLGNTLLGKVFGGK